MNQRRKRSPISINMHNVKTKKTKNKKKRQQDANAICLYNVKKTYSEEAIKIDQIFILYVNKHLPDGSIALIWDHCAAHLIENTYFRITILELPENTTSVNQP